MKQGVSVFYKLYCERADGKTDSNKNLGREHFIRIEIAEKFELSK